MNALSKSANDRNVHETLEIIKQQALPITETVLCSSFKAINHVLAKKVVAQKNTPERDNSAMDGYVFLESDLIEEIREFPVSGEIRPEDKSSAKLRQGTCLRIMTGAPVPEPACIVIPVELVEESGDKIHVLKIPDRNPIRKKGEGYQKGMMILPRNTLIRPYEAGLLIESGNTHVTVKKPQKIIIQVTGSELDKSNNTNGPVLEELLSQWPGTDVKQAPVLTDDPELTCNTLKTLSKTADIVVTTGGISMGRHDYVLQSMEKIGAEVLIRKVMQKPGKPFTLTKLENTYFFHLPGNPVSTIFCAEMYLQLFLFHRFELNVSKMKAISRTEITNHRKNALFVHGQLQWNEGGQAEVRMEPKMRSHLLHPYTGNNVYVYIEPDTDIKPGDHVEVIPFSRTLPTFF